MICFSGEHAHVHEKPGSNVCAAFLSNSNPQADSIVAFRGVKYSLPRYSISILSDCKTVVFIMQRVNAQHNVWSYHNSKEANKDQDWKMYQETVPTIDQTTIKSSTPLELMNLTKDTTNCLWYVTSFNLEDEDLPMRHDIRPVIQVSNLGHAMHIFVNDVYIGSGHGTNLEKSFPFAKPTDLKGETNHISLLGMSVGLPIRASRKHPLQICISLSLSFSFFFVILPLRFN